MAKARKGVKPVEALQFSAIILLDEDQRTREAVSERLQAQFGDAHRVFKVPLSDEGMILLRSFREEKGLNLCVIAVNVTPQSDVDVAKPDQLIAKLREEVPQMTRIIAYTDKPLEQVREQALAAGASSCVAVDDVEADVYGVFLEEELVGLDALVPVAAGVVNTINVGISIQNPQMDVLWANARTSSVVHESDREQRRCWKRYHKFCHRKGPCPDCTAFRVLRSANQQVAQGKPVGNGRLTGYHLLPIQGRIGRVEVNAAPLMSRDGRKVLAVIEASRFVTEEWEKNTEAHDRLHEVIAAARDLGQQREGASPFVTLAVYYRPGEDQDLHLFDLAAEEGHTVAKVLRLAECPAVYREVLADGQPRFFAEAAPDATLWHFLWPAKTPAMGIEVLIDVVYADDKPEGLFTEDLRPYWEYVIENFDAARETREKAFQQTTDSLPQEFLGSTANGVRDQASLDRALDEAVQCVKKALAPLSMYVRTLDRKSSTLVKRCGFGPYYEIAPKNRELRYEGIGSAMVASSRKGYWIRHAELTEIRRFFSRELSASEETDLKRIAGYVALPLLWMDRILGTLCIQFEDDSLFSPAKCRFVEAMAAALGSALGSLEWVRQRAAVAKYSNELDRTMFQRSERPEEEETSLLAQVTRMLFEVTASELVAYYRHDIASHNLTLVPGATQGTLPADMKLPDVIPGGVGIVSLAAVNMRGYRVQDYRGDDWQAVRKRLTGAFPRGPEHAFCLWVGSEIAEPVIAGHSVVGVLAALSSIPGWLSADDAEVVGEFAFKTGLCLEAKELTRQLNWHSRVKMSLNDITAAMARISDVSTLHRLLLLAITTDECLGFSRAILFLRQNGDEHKLVASEAVGARSHSEAEVRWQEANATALRVKMDACAQPPRTRSGDLRQLLPELVLDLGEHPEILQSFREGKMAVRRRGETHLLRDAHLLAAVCPEGNQEGEYVLTPLTAGGEMIGAVLADRAFLQAAHISPERLELLQSLTREFSRMLEAVKLRREEQEATIAMELARGVSYSLRTRAAALDARISNFAHTLGGAHEAAIGSLKRAVKFFGRGGSLASRLLRLGEIGVGRGEKLDLNAILEEMVAALADPRITLERAAHPVCVQAERHYVEDLLLEILWNACEFTHRQTGQVRVTVGVEGTMARVDCVDNGPGIHPELRPHLFKPFKCYPASRMGLGLSYVARLVEAYGGTVEEIGSWQQGAHFVVQIPLVEVPQNESG